MDILEYSDDETIDVPLLEAQAEQIECGDMFAAARGGNRAGKSIGWAYWLYFQRLQEYPLAVHAVAGSDYENLRRGFFPLMCGVLESLGWVEGEDFMYRASGAPTLFLPRLHKHAKLHSLSVKLLERLKGTSIQTLVLEEPQAWDTKDMSGKRKYEILITRLSHSQKTRLIYPKLQPQLRMSFNPPAEGSWLYKLIEEQWKPQGFKCWRMSVRDNFLLAEVDPLYVARLEANIEPRRQPAEIDGHWQTGGGGVYYAYDSLRHGKPPETIPAVDWVDETRPLEWTHDFGVKMVCSVICQTYEQPKIQLPKLNPEDPFEYTVPEPTWQPTILRVLGEFALTNSNTEAMLEAFVNSKWLAIAQQVGVDLYGDPSGGTRAMTAWARGAAKTPWDILTRGLRAHGVVVRRKYVAVDPGPKNRAYAVNDQFNAGGRAGVTVNVPEVPVLTNDWLNVEWDKSGQKIVKTDELSHASDAYAYRAFALRASMREDTTTWAWTRNKK